MKQTLQRWMFNLPAVLIVSVLVDLALIAIGRSGIGMPMGDLFLAYQSWADQVFKDSTLFGITTAWVYPWPALVPMVVSNLLTPGALWFSWLCLVTITQALTVGLFVTRKPEPHMHRRYLAAYAWLGFTMLLGPVSISRVDAFSVQLALIGVLFIATKSRVSAAAFLTAAAWIKVWPIALFSPLAFSAEKVRRVVLAGVAVTLGFVAIALAAGGNLVAIFSFALGQSSRGIQIESPFAMPWLWASATQDPNSGISYNQSLMTFEVFGPGTELVASLLNLVQVGAVLITLTLIFLATKKTAFDDQHPLNKEIITWGSFTFVLDLIVFNKVGSPQYMTWIPVTLVLGMLVGATRMRVPMVLLAITTSLTWWLYPFAYDSLLMSETSAVLLLITRNCFEIALLVYGNYRLTQLATKQLAQ